MGKRTVFIGKDRDMGGVKVCPNCEAILQGSVSLRSEPGDSDIEPGWPVICYSCGEILEMLEDEGLQRVSEETLGKIGEEGREVVFGLSERLKGIGAG